MCVDMDVTGEARQLAGGPEHPDSSGPDDLALDDYDEFGLDYALTSFSSLGKSASRGGGDGGHRIERHAG